MSSGESWQISLFHLFYFVTSSAEKASIKEKYRIVLSKVLHTLDIYYFQKEMFFSQKKKISITD